MTGYNLYNKKDGGDTAAITIHRFFIIVLGLSVEGFSIDSAFAAAEPLNT
jgi:hypothetical protein